MPGHAPHHGSTTTQQASHVNADRPPPPGGRRGRTAADDAPLRSITRGTRAWMVAFAVLTLVATNQLFVLSEHTDRWFSWTIQPPLSAAFLGAGYGAGFVLMLLSLRTTAWVNARVSVVTVLAFTVLTLLATLTHLDRFHFFADGLVARFAAWFWLAVYVVVPVGLAVVVVLQHRIRAPDPARRRPLPAALAVVLAVQGAVMLVTGVILFVQPAAAANLWPWTLTPLTSRMIAAWLLSFGLAMGLAWWERDLGRLEIPAIGYTVFGVLQLLALLRFRDQVAWDGTAATVYLVVLLTLPLTGALGWWLARRGRRLDLVQDRS
jgi:hypothetical protein